MVNANIYCWTAFGIRPVPVLEKEIRLFVDSMEFRGQKSNIFMILPLWQLCQNLLGMAASDPKVLTGEIITEEEYFTEAQEKNPHSALWVHFDLCFLEYLFGDYESAQGHASQCRILDQFPFCSFAVVNAILFDGLSALALYTKDRKRRRRRIRCAKHAVRSMSRWSRYSVNFLGHLHLLKAELAATIGDSLEAASNFTCAIALTAKGGFLFLEALSNELAGRFFLQKGTTCKAAIHFKEAYRLYVTWGGYAKADHLKKELAFYLESA
jgi:tetratricopeptide (TPR) repeat protein